MHIDLNDMLSMDLAGFKMTTEYDHTSGSWLQAANLVSYIAQIPSDWLQLVFTLASSLIRLCTCHLTNLEPVEYPRRGQ